MFIVLEVQTYDDGSIGIVPPTAYENSDEAQAKYHTILAAAAISQLPMHTAFVLTSDGYVVESRCFRHEVEEQSEE